MQELEKILEEIEKAKGEPWYRLNNYDVRHKLDGAINRIVEIIRKHLNDGWIPAEDRMPENGEDVLVQWDFYSRCDNMTYTYIHIMRLNKMTGEWNGTYGVPNGKVIAWRPLPEPYRPERKDEDKNDKHL